MVEKKVILCDICNKSVANSKCSFCKKDICDKCMEKEVIGTVVLKVCKGCNRKLKRIKFERESFWEEFNKMENMQEKIIKYLEKNLILKNLSDDEDEEEDNDDYDYQSGIRKRRIGIGRMKIRR